jgi:ABC-type Na+ efflux pump permease subunit
MYRPEESFGRSSPLFWLSLMVAAGIIFIGVRFLLSPLVAAEAFGVPLVSGAGVAFSYAKGMRDIFAGLVIFPFLLMGQRRALAWIMLVATIIPVVDGLIVLRFSGFQPRFLSVHWGTALFLALLAFLLFRSRGRKDDAVRSVPTTTNSSLRTGEADRLPANAP